MFTVHSDRGRLIVTPSSGIGRVIPGTEFQAAWPYLEREAPKQAWQHVSNNTSYLEAIYDEVVEELPTLESFVAARVRAASREAGPVIDWEARYRDQRRQFAEAYRKLQAELAEKDAAIAKRDQAGKVLAGQVQRQERELDDLKGRLETVEQAKVATEVVLGHVRRELKDDRDATRMAAQAAVPRAGRLDADVARLKQQLAHANASLTDAITQQGQAQAKAAAAQREVEELRRELGAVKAAKPTTPPPADTVTISFDIAKLSFAHDRAIDKRHARILHGAAKQVFDRPDAAILECRRVLEACAKRLWEQEHPGRTAGGAFWVLMDELRNGAIPISEWHLMKNIWSTASGIVHEGGGTPDVALWVWLGCARVAEMCAPSVSSPA
jgi:predicted  nucleic acid-binding Zn-ribbon protein